MTKINKCGVCGTSNKKEKTASIVEIVNRVVDRTPELRKLLEPMSKEMLDAFTNYENVLMELHEQVNK